MFLFGFHSVKYFHDAMSVVSKMSQADNCEIRTDRLLLRQFTPDDFEAYATIMRDYEVMKWFPKGEGYTRKEAKKSLNNITTHWTEHGYGIWAVVDKRRGVLLGRCGLNLIEETSEVEVDFITARPHWNQGYATEAAKATLAYGFNVLKLNRIIALAKPDNISSRRVMDKIGMQYVKDAQYWGITCAYYEITR